MEKLESIGERVARSWKRQYFKNGKWAEINGWDQTPEEIYTVLLELRTERAVLALVDSSWLRKPRKKKTA